MLINQKKSESNPAEPGPPPKYYDILLGKRVKKEVKIGTPFQWDLI